MRFLHTADWHLGNSMHNIDRTEESAKFLEWLKNKIIETDTECLIVAGDIFDVYMPPSKARELLNNFLASLLGSCCKNVILVGGNHDSAADLDANCAIFDAINVCVIGSIENHSLKDLVKEIKNENGEVVGICAAVPFVREIELRKFVTEDCSNDKSFAEISYAKLYKDIFEIADKLRNNRNIPIIATGHLYASKLDGKNGDSVNVTDDRVGHGVKDIVGNLGTVPVTVFGDNFDYVALGHIHYNSMVAKNPKVRYSGSPFVLGFDECNLSRCVLLVDTQKGEVPNVQKIDVPHYFKFERVKGNVNEIRNKLIELRNYNGTLPLKLEIVYDYEAYVNVRDSIDDLLENAPFEIVNWKFNRPETLNVSDFDDGSNNAKYYTPEEIFKLLIASKVQKNEVEELYKEYLPMFQEVINECQKENAQKEDA